MSAILETKVSELQAAARAKLTEVEAIVSNPNASGEDKTKAASLTEEIKALQTQAANMSELVKTARAMEAQAKAQPTATPETPGKFKSLGEMLCAVHAATFYQRFDTRLSKPWSEPGEAADTKRGNGWMQQKDLVENVGASGGFLVPVEQREELLKVPAPAAVVRPRALAIPMRARQIQWPTLDQTNTTAGQPAWFGGVLGKWTEEAGEKYETEPDFRQINLVAHKLVCYTEASDELLADSAVGLEVLLGSLFQQTIAWYEEEAFVNGTGAGQPRGIISAPATFAQARAVAGAIGIVDIINMLEHFYGSDPVWLISRSALPSLMQLNGPAANPSYVFMPSARDGMPGTLFGYPIFWNEHCPLIGNRGDIVLADLKMYLIGDRQATTIDASKHFKFQNDITAWRAVHRVDGQPWLSQPIYWSDGTTQVSPFVVLDGGGGS